MLSAAYKIQHCCFSFCSLTGSPPCGPSHHPGNLSGGKCSPYFPSFHLGELRNSRALSACCFIGILPPQVPVLITYHYRNSSRLWKHNTKSWFSFAPARPEAAGVYLLEVTKSGANRDGSQAASVALESSRLKQCFFAIIFTHFFMRCCSPKLS